jgi:hypothetical protein
LSGEGTGINDTLHGFLGCLNRGFHERVA